MFSPSRFYGTMASAEFLQFVVTMLRFGRAYSLTPARPPRVSSITFASSICRIYAPEFVQYWTSFCRGNSSVPNTPCMRFLSVKPRFCPWVSILPTSDFLRIPPHDGHPCLRLTVPTAKSVADFHRQVIAHAERTIKETSFVRQDKRRFSSSVGICNPTLSLRKTS